MTCLPTQTSPARQLVLPAHPPEFGAQVEETAPRLAPTRSRCAGDASQSDGSTRSSLGKTSASPPDRPQRAPKRANQTSRRSRYAARRVSGNEIRKKITITKPKIAIGWSVSGKRQVLELAIRGLEHLRHADHGGDRRVLDDVHEQADHRRDEPPERLRDDHERVSADPAEAEGGRSLVLLPRDRLNGSARRLRNLRASPRESPIAADANALSSNRKPPTCAVAIQ